MDNLLYSVYNNLLSVGNITDNNNISFINTNIIEYWNTEFCLSIAASASFGAIGCVLSSYNNIINNDNKNEYKNYIIDCKHASAALNSHKYSTINNKPFDKLWNEFSGFYKCSNNTWIQLHCNYPHHRDNVLKSLNCINKQRKYVEEELLKNTGEYWETYLTNRECCVSFIRTRKEWQLFSQYNSINNLPLFTITKIQDSDIEIPKPGKYPLSNIRILDLSRVLAGPVGCKILGQLGADILKITSKNLPFIKSLVPDTNIGKRSSFIDLNNNEDCNTLKELIKDCDVFFQAYRPNSLQQKGFGPEDLAKIRPGIIYVSLCAYSHKGIWANKRGFDSLVQSSTGIVNEQTKFMNSNTPCHWPVSAQDYITGFLSVYTTILALRKRALEGGSYHVQISLAQTGNWISNIGRIQGQKDNNLLKEENIKEYLDTIETEWGTLQYLKPVIPIDNYNPLPPTSLGKHKASWI